MFNFISQFNLNYSLVGISIKNYLIAILIFLISSLFFLILQRRVLNTLEKLAKKTKTDIDDVIIETIRKVKPPFYYFLSLYLALRYLNFSNEFNKIADAVLVVILILQILTAGQTFIDFLFKKLSQRQKDKGSRVAMGYLSRITQIILWSSGFLLILANLGVNITSLVAGLGISGIAIAFALQNILADLFSSFAIFFDKPFVTGDLITVGKYTGTVERIGIKTTRLRSLQGEEIVISNQELTSAQIQNFKKLKKRRVVLELGLEYNTSAEELKSIPEIIKNIFTDIKNTEFDRSHFKSFGDSALIFETVYYVTSSDYTDYMDAQQEVNLAIVHAFAQHGLNLAFPTTTVHIVRE